MKFSLRLLYLYLFSFVGLLITVIGAIQLVDLSLKKYVFRVSQYSYPISAPIVDNAGKVEMTVEEQKEQQRLEAENTEKRSLSSSLAMIAIGIPLYLYHWGTIKKEAKK
jgi:hypothetical protein